MARQIKAMAFGFSELSETAKVKAVKEVAKTKDVVSDNWAKKVKEEFINNAAVIGITVTNIHYFVDERTVSEAAFKGHFSTDMRKVEKINRYLSGYSKDAFFNVSETIRGICYNDKYVVIDGNIDIKGKNLFDADNMVIKNVRASVKGDDGKLVEDVIGTGEDEKTRKHMVDRLNSVFIHLGNVLAISLEKEWWEVNSEKNVRKMLEEGTLSAEFFEDGSLCKF